MAFQVKLNPPRKLELIIATMATRIKSGVRVAKALMIASGRRAMALEGSLNVPASKTKPAAKSSEILLNKDSPNKYINDATQITDAAIVVSCERAS